jgi:hypothetical protein
MSPSGDRSLSRSATGGDRDRTDDESPDTPGSAPVTPASGSGVRAGARAERALAIGALLAVPAIAPLRNVQWAGSWASAILLCAGVLLCWFLLARVLGPLCAWIVRATDGMRLRNVVGAGVLAQILAALLTAPVPVSDFEHYSYIARQIASQLVYSDELGRRAQWPPGWPLAYAPFVWIFGTTLVATTLANVALYLCAASATWSLANRLAGRSAGTIATLLLTFWPSRLLMAGLAAKENLLIALVIAGTALAIRALDPATRRPLATALGAGAALGAATLTQPGVFLLLPVVPLCYRFAMAAMGPRRFVVWIAAVVGGATIAVVPWMMRNCVVFEGAFCGVSSNGGSVFYRVNNANATGFYMPERGTPLEGLSEVEKNRRGYELGRQWIAAHPVGAARLAARKIAGYLGSDDYGAYWSVLRGSGGSEDSAIGTASKLRVALYRLASVVSLAYWVVLTTLCAQTILKWPSPDTQVGRMLPPFIYPLLCGAVVFGIFESGDRQHMFAVAPLIVLAAVGIAPRAGALHPRVPDAGT